MRRRNPIPKAWGKTPILFTFQDSPNENLDGEDLRLANLEGTNLSGSSFRKANLEGANLAGCDLSDCDFTGANLDGADLAFAKVDGAIFKDCSVEGAIFFDFIKLFTVSVFEPINFERSQPILTTLTTTASRQMSTSLRRSKLLLPRQIQL